MNAKVYIQDSKFYGVFCEGNWFYIDDVTGRRNFIGGVGALMMLERQSKQVSWYEKALKTKKIYLPKLAGRTLYWYDQY